MAIRSGIQSSLLRVLPDTVAARGLDPAALWARMGLSPPDPTSPGADLSDARVSLSDWCDTLDLAERLTGDPAIGLWSAQTVRPPHLGALGYALLSSGHGADGLSVYQRFQAQFCDTLAIQPEPGIGQVTLRHVALVGELPRHAAFWCFMFGAQLAFARWVSGRDLVPLSIDIPAPQPAVPLAQAFARLCACPIRYNAPHAAQHIPLAWLAWLNPNADGGLHASMQARLMSAQCPVDAGVQLVHRARQATRSMLREGTAIDLAGVVAQLQRAAQAGEALSPRQLQDRLAATGHPIKALIDAVRREEAQRLLADPSVPLAHVAQACGYAEPSPFHRAVKRWTGLTPAQVRAKGWPAPVVNPGEHVSDRP